MPSAGISIAARTRSRRPEGSFLILAPVPRRAPLDPLAFIVALARERRPRSCASGSTIARGDARRPHGTLSPDADTGQWSAHRDRIRRTFPAASIWARRAAYHRGSNDEAVHRGSARRTTNYASPVSAVFGLDRVRAGWACRGRGGGMRRVLTRCMRPQRGFWTRRATRRRSESRR